MKKIIFFILFLFTFPAACAIEDDNDLFYPVEIKDGSSISITDCVAAAFKNSPKIKRQKYNLDIAKSNVGMAKSQYFPIISMGAGFYNENNSDNTYYYSHYRELPSAAVTVNKLIWDFGKTTAYIKMEEFYKLGAEYEYADSLCSALFEVKEKYYALLKSKAMFYIAQNNVKINEDFVKLAKKKPDYTTALVNLSKAEIKLIEADNDYLNSKVDLTNAMYLDGQPDYNILNTPTFDYNREFSYEENNSKTKPFEPEKFNFNIEEAVQIAYENSPDLKVLYASKEAMEQSLQYIKKTYLPDLTANAAYNLYNTNQTANNSFQAGVNLTTSVNIMELRHNIKGAEAQVNYAENEISLYKKDLFFEVKRAFNNLEKTERQIPVSQTAAEQALENLKLVESQYKTDELNYVALQNAGKDYIYAMKSYIESIYNYNTALIQVERAMHYHIADIHHKSEHAVHYHSSELIEHLNKVLGCDETEILKSKKRKHKAKP